MPKTILGFPDPDNDPLRNLRDSQRRLRDIQRSMEPPDISAAIRNMQKSMRTLDTTAAIRDVQKSMRTLDTSAVIRDVQKSMRTLDTSAVIRDVQRSMTFDTSAVVKDIQKSLQSDAFRQTLQRSLGSQNLSADLAQALRQSRVDLATLSAQAADEAGAPYVRAVESEARNDDEGAPSILGDWIEFLSVVRKRRLLLLSLAALNQVMSLAAEYSDTELPAHLQSLILTLLAVAVLLSEYIGEPEDDDPKAQ